IFILEDAAYRGLGFLGQEPPSLWSEDSERDTVILARTFSKTLSPGLKIGYAVVPESLVEPILDLKGNHDFGTANFNQQVLEQSLADGSYEAHVRDLLKIYRRKCEVFLSALEKYVRPVDREIRWTCPKGGLFVWMTAPDGLDTSFRGP